MVFKDRADAGRALAEALRGLRLSDPLIVGLPRGGVPVAAEIAAALAAPLDVFVVRKIGAPGHEEFGIGAVAEGGFTIADRHVLARLGISDEEFARLAARERTNVEVLVDRYRPDRPLTPVAGRNVVVVDDGLATGVTAEAALHGLRQEAPASLVLAEPVCALDQARRLEGAADRIVCTHLPADFGSVGAWYRNFDPTTDEEVMRHLGQRVR